MLCTWQKQGLCICDLFKVVLSRETGGGGALGRKGKEAEQGLKIPSLCVVPWGALELTYRSESVLH